MARPKLQDFSGSVKKVLMDRGPDWKEWLYIDELAPENAAMAREYDLEDILNKQKGMSDYRMSKGPMQHCANVPPHVLEKALREKWDASDWKKWANNYDNRIWREGCYKGKI